MANPLLAKFLQTLKHSDLPKGWQDNPEIVEEAGRLYREMGTESPFFKAWERSKGGDTQRVYHGGAKGIEEFQPRADDYSMYGKGIYLTPKKDIAEGYARNGELYDLFSSIENPLKAGRSKDFYTFVGKPSAEQKYDFLQRKGYGGVVDTSKSYPQTLATDPTQIKSTSNRGTFDPQDPNILRQVLPYVIGGGAAAGATLAPSDSEAANIGPRGFRNLFGGELTDATRGAFRGADNMLRYEIPDNAMKMNKNFLREFLNSDSSTGATSYLGDAVEHQQLFKAYPELADMDLTVNRLPTGQRPRGEFYPSSGMMDAKASNLRELMDTISHEQQHGVQSLEGFSGGSNPASAGSFNQYYNSPGELEARAVADRRRLTGQQREANPQDMQQQWRNFKATEKPLEEAVWSPADLAVAPVGIGRAGLKAVLSALALDAPLTLGMDYGADKLGSFLDSMEKREPQNIGAWF